MFDISFMEILVISIVALIVIGPERLPTVARTLGHLYGRCRNFVYSVRTDIHNEIRMEELKHMQSSVHETVQSIENSVQQSVDQLKTTLATADVESKENISTDTSAPRSDSELQQSIPDEDKFLNTGFDKDKK
jgi:sec-independent protein translocase protein TatB